MLLSILIPGKNDEHFNAFERLSHNLKKTISNLEITNFKDVEVVLCDWGSEVKITDKLNIETNSNFKCVYVDPSITQKYNREAKYSIVHPINTAFKNSTGKYVIFWDSDCFVTLKDFISLYNFVKKMDQENDMSFYWGSRYHIPYEVHNNASDITEIENYLDTTDLSLIPHDKIDCNNFMGMSISILMNRELWETSTGWWEELVYWGWQDIEFHSRLRQRYNFNGDLEDHGINFFHLNHHGVTVIRHTNHHMNSSVFEANGEVWGLSNEQLLVY